jgi:hypothetical protein
MRREEAGTRRAYRRGHAGIISRPAAWGGAAPLRMHNGMTVITEAEIRGHWQAAGIMRARTDRSDKTETRTTMGRIQLDRADLSATGHFDRA